MKVMRKRSARSFTRSTIRLLMFRSLGTLCGRGRSQHMLVVQVVHYINSGASLPAVECDRVHVLCTLLNTLGGNDSLYVKSHQGASMFRRVYFHVCIIIVYGTNYVSIDGRPLLPLLMNFVAA